MQTLRMKTYQRQKVNPALKPLLVVLSGMILLLQLGTFAVYLITAIPICVIGAKEIIRAANRTYAVIVFLLMGKIVHVRGRENIDESKSYLIVANHASYYDPAGISTFLPATVWLGKERFARLPLLSTYLRALDYIPVYPGDSERSKNSINNAVKRIGKCNIVIFPEGTRTPTGKILPFKKGFVHIAKNTGLDVLPITLNGFSELMPRFRLVINPFVRIEAVIHEALPNEIFCDSTADDVTHLVRSIIESEYTGLRD